MALTEKQIEDVFEIFFKQLIGADLTFVARQHILDNGLRVDLLLQDNNKRTVAVELKKDAITREDIGQTLQYAGLIKNSRVILAAPIIASSIKTAFDHYGIEYLEFDLKEISKLYYQIKDKPKTEILTLANQISVPLTVIAEPLENRTKKDGNIAFKVTYVDSEWKGVCSDNLYEHNIVHRTWCGIQADHKINCRSKKFQNPDNLNEASFPCYDSVALKILSFSPGVDHGETRNDIVRRCLEAKVGKRAVFTSREPGEPENERFIFAVAIIESIYPPEDGYSEAFYCNRTSAIIFNKNNYPKFWKYYRNANNPDRIAWSTGLFRYITDNVVINLLTDITSDNRYSAKTKEKAKILMDTIQ